METTYTSNNRCWISSHGAIDIIDSSDWNSNMISLPYNVTIAKYIPFGECYSYTDDTIINQKDEQAICNFLKPARDAGHIEEKEKYYGRKGHQFPEVYFTSDDDGNFQSNIAICNNDGGWSIIYNLDNISSIKLSEVIDLLNNKLNGDTYDLHILTCLTEIEEEEEDEEEEEEDYDDRNFYCDICNDSITLYEDRWHLMGNNEDICSEYGYSQISVTEK